MSDLNLAVRITGDASSLRQATADAVGSTSSLTSAVDAATGRLNANAVASTAAAAATKAADRSAIDQQAIGNPIRDANLRLPVVGNVIPLPSSLRPTLSAPDSFGPEVPSGVPAGMWSAASQTGGKFGGSLSGASTAPVSSAVDELSTKIRAGGDATEGALKDVSAQVDSSGSFLGGVIKRLGSVFDSSGVPGGGGVLKLFGGTPAADAPANDEGGLFRGRGTGTSDSNVTRISHGEYIVNAAATARHLPILEAINDHSLPQFAEGGYVGHGPVTARRDRSGERPAPGSGGAAPALNVENHVHNNAGVDVEQKSSRDQQGNLRLDTIISRAVGKEMGRPGSPISDAMHANFGLKRATTRR